MVYFKRAEFWHRTRSGPRSSPGLIMMMDTGFLDLLTGGYAILISTETRIDPLTGIENSK